MKDILLTVYAIMVVAGFLVGFVGSLLVALFDILFGLNRMFMDIGFTLCMIGVVSFILIIITPNKILD